MTHTARRSVDAEQRRRERTLSRGCKALTAGFTLIRTRDQVLQRADLMLDAQHSSQGPLFRPTPAPATRHMCYDYSGAPAELLVGEELHR